MKSILKKIIPKNILNLHYLNILEKEYQDWVKGGKIIPSPHAIKQRAILNSKKKFALDTLIETGTYKGNMVLVQKNYFKQVISIEVGEQLFLNAKELFKNDNNVTIIHGDSGAKLPEILKDFTHPVLLWLDGHYSYGDTAKGNSNTPILEELKTILSQNVDHVVLIDDAIDYKGTDGYPTLEEIKNFVFQLRPDYEFSLLDNIVYLHKPINKL